MRGAEVIGEGLFVMDACHVRIALLLFAQQAFFRREDGAGAVDVDRAAFENDASADRFRANLGGVGSLGHQAADFFVVAPVGVLGPRVEAELQGQRALRG